MVGRLLNSQQGCLTAVGLVAALVYVNTLLGDFTFDDNFAVITNADVTDAGIPIRDLFKHDFWGQDITSTQSHKSYRPLTILVFRFTHHAWWLLTAAVPGIPQLLDQLPISQPVQDDSRVARPQGLHPFPFHTLCVVMHAVASLLVFGLCQHLFAVLEDSSSSSSSSSTSTSAQTGSAQQQPGGSGKAVLQQLVMWQQQLGWWRIPGSSKCKGQALLAGLMFALHPIHTEAVAGIVGCAELLCVALACPALLCYFLAVDGRYAAAQQLQAQSAAADSTHASTDSSRDTSRQRSTGRSVKQQKRPQTVAGASAATAVPGVLLTGDAVQHWLLVLAAAVLAFAAALTKEIGITVIGTMLLYDMLLAPHIRRPATAAGSGSGRVVGQQLQPAAARRQLMRMVFVAATAVVYVKMRQWVAVQQLVHIYRKVENPIPFAESRLTRTLSTGYLHARYFGLLLMPLHLSADWSFSCIPLVEHLADVRNLATLALYCYFIYTALAAHPLGLLRQLWSCAKVAVGLAVSKASTHTSLHADTATKAGNGNAGAACEGAACSDQLPKQTSQAAAATASCARRRWRLMVLVGLVVAPFFPASNVLFYVGTFIGERLLYSPSIGFCLLAAELLGAALPSSWQQHDLQSSKQEPRQQAAADGANSAKAPLEAAAAQQQASSTAAQADRSIKEPSTGTSSSLPASSWGFLLLCVLLLGGYAYRTLLRNQDWWDEERLFLSALKVCPNSAKVQQNNGVLQRRFKKYAVALGHFKRAQEIEPGYCEPTYWIGLTSMNMGDARNGLSILQSSLSCRYTAAEALQALNKVYLMMMDAGRGKDPGPMVEWAAVLASPHVLRIADACSTAEDAALGAALAGKGPSYVSQAVGVCLKGLQEWEHGETHADTLAALAKQRGDLNATLLSECVKMRLAVYEKLASHPVASMPVRHAVYKYMAQVMKDSPGCRSLQGGGPMSLGSADGSPDAPVPTTHQKLLHKVQGADPEDPWLQHEWGASLLALGPNNLKDAAMHLEVSAAIFAKASQDILRAQQGGSQGSSQPDGAKLLLHLTELDGKTPLTPVTSLQAAMRPLMTFKEAAASSTDSDIAVQLCEVLQRLCHTQLQAVMLLQQQRQAGRTQVDGKALQEATEAARQCLADISGRPACTAQAARLRKMVRSK